MFLKIMIQILTKTGQTKVEAVDCLGDDQLDSEGGIGTRDATGVLRVLIERSCQQGQDMYICFVDYENPIDRVTGKS